MYNENIKIVLETNTKEEKNMVEAINLGAVHTHTHTHM